MFSLSPYPKELDSLEMKCPTTGCIWKGPYLMWREHIKVPCLCSNGCYHKKAVCKYCDLIVKFSDLKAHQDLCGLEIIMCACKWEGQRKDKSLHLKSDCKVAETLSRKMEQAQQIQNSVIEVSDDD
jgi:hypothetical protein